MTREELQDLSEATPFVPFTLVTANHQRYDVDHPDFLLLPPAPPNPDAKYWSSHRVTTSQQFKAFWGPPGLGNRRVWWS